MKKLILFLLLFFTFQISLGENPDQPIQITLKENSNQIDPIQVSSEEVPQVPDDLKGLVWNKWDTDNFIILSIDKDQGLFLKNNIEKIKDLILEKWGINNFKFSNKCKIVCVTNEKLLERIFRIKEPKFEVRKKENNEIELCAVWFSLEDNQIPYFEIANVCFEESGLNLPQFCVSGMSMLSDSDRFVEELLSSDFSISKNEILESSNEDSKSVDNFEIKSAVVCLLLRKEFGQKNFSNFLQNNNYDVFGFDDDLSKFDEILERYHKNLINDLSNGKVPESYLRIGE